MNKLSLEQRRQMLVARCDTERHDAAYAVGTLLHPVASSSMLGSLGGIGLKLPLAIAGVVLGMVAIKPRRAMAIVSTGLTLWKVATGVLGALRPAGQTSVE
ncbi:MAG: hypothetical protein ABIT83_22835 [Massilia sp.]